jgi:hypothetical protein
MPQCAPRSRNAKPLFANVGARWLGPRRLAHEPAVMTCFDGSELTPGAFHKSLQGDR